MKRRFLGILLMASGLCAAQTAKPSPWTMQNSGTPASLRGIHAVGKGVAWASGTDGTVLRTEDGGIVWQHCAVPKGAEKLDFRGIWAWDAQTAIVMSSGPGDASRIYKTTDGCKTWALKYTNLEPAGFWDAIVFATEKQGFVLGDPVDGAFRIYTTRDQGETWFLLDDAGLEADAKSAGAFAASNSALAVSGSLFWFGSGGTGGAYVSHSYAKCPAGIRLAAGCPEAWEKVAVPLSAGAAGGVFSVGAQVKLDTSGGLHSAILAVGGDYEKPNETTGTAAYSHDGGKTWTAAAVPPHGYRSAVAYDQIDRAWIAAGTNGSDYSRDDGKTWHPLDDGDWNALSLPYVVGPKGRIAKLTDGAVPGK
jgi:photosystem II stability/assembly factor-like uncharacterized protein